jgi:hypothetical protein
MLMKKNAHMLRKQFLWLGPRVILLNCAYFDAFYFSYNEGPLVGPYPLLASLWTKKRLLITSSSWPKKSAWVKLGWRFLGLGLR